MKTNMVVKDLLAHLNRQILLYKISVFFYLNL